MVLFPCFLFFLLLLLEFSLCKQVLPLNSIPLLALKCNPSSSSSSSFQNPSISSTTLLHNLTLNPPPPTSLLTTSNITFGQDHYSGLLQCRPGLTPAQCSLCAAAARTAISAAHCAYNNSDAAISAWFDGCYIQISSRNPPEYPSITNHYSCSPGNPNPDQFVPALETLLLQLRAAVTIPTRRGFSRGQIAYGDHNQKTLCGLAECVRSISTKECERCVGDGIEKLLIRCGGGGNHGGGTVIDGPCLVRFGGANGTVCNAKLEDSADVTIVGASGFSDGDEEHWCRKEAVLAYWGGGVGCFAAAVLLVGLVRRAVLLNRAKVGALESGETVGKS